MLELVAYLYNIDRNYLYQIFNSFTPEQQQDLIDVYEIERPANQPAPASSSKQEVKAAQE